MIFSTPTPSVIVPPAGALPTVQVTPPPSSTVHVNTVPGISVISSMSVLALLQILGELLVAEITGKGLTVTE